MTQEVRRDRAPSTVELLLDLVKARFWSIVVVILGIIVVTGYIGFDIEVPRRLKLAVIGIVAISPYGYIVGKYIIGLLWSPENVFVVDIDARFVDGALYRFPYEDFRELEVSEGQLDELTPWLHVGKDVDLDEMTVKGTWRGTLSDRELLMALSKIDECRGQLEKDAQKGFALRTQAFTIIRSCVRSGVESVVEVFEQKSLPDRGESIEAAIDDALDRYDLDREIDERLEDMDIEADDLDPETIDRESPDSVEDRPDRVDHVDGQPPQEATGDD